LFGEGSVAAAEIEDLFAGLGIEEHDYVGGQGCDKAAVGSVGFGVPSLSNPGAHGGIVSPGGTMREQDKNFCGRDKRESKIAAP